MLHSNSLDAEVRATETGVEFEVILALEAGVDIEGDIEVEIGSVETGVEV